VVLEDDLINSALKVSCLKTKKVTIEEGLKMLIQVESQSHEIFREMDITKTNSVNILRSFNIC